MWGNLGSAASSIGSSTGGWGELASLAGLGLQGWGLINNYKLGKQQLGLMKDQWGMQKKIYDQDLADREFQRTMNI